MCKAQIFLYIGSSLPSSLAMFQKRSPMETQTASQTAWWWPWSEKHTFWHSSWTLFIALSRDGRCHTLIFCSHSARVSNLCWHWFRMFWPWCSTIYSCFTFFNPSPPPSSLCLQCVFFIAHTKADAAQFLTLSEAMKQKILKLDYGQL